MAKIRGLIFDFNGTLFFDSRFHIESFRRCSKKYGVPCLSDQQTVTTMFGKSNERIFKDVFNSNATPEEIAEFERLKEGSYMDICRENPDSLHLCDGACEMLDFLQSRKIPYCIATGSPYENVKFYFDYLDLGRWFTFDNIVYINGEFPGKPAPDTYLRAAARLNLSADECAVFEDATSGILSARAAGAARVIAVWENGLPSPITEAAYADAIYHDLKQYKEILHDLDLI